MRRMGSLLATMALGVVLTCGVALAANKIDCRDQPDGRCTGTPRADVIVDTRRDETIRGLGGDDTIRGGDGRDALLGGRGGDRIVADRCSLPDGVAVRGGRGDDAIDITSDCGGLTVVPPADRVDCGPGDDTVRGAARRDGVAADCERVLTDGS